jgi:hypothetical protein
VHVIASALLLVLLRKAFMNCDLRDCALFGRSHALGFIPLVPKQSVTVFFLRSTLCSRNDKMTVSFGAICESTTNS